MKTPYEIAWEFMPECASSRSTFQLSDLSRITGIKIEELNKMVMKYHIKIILEHYKPHFDLVRSVIAEIEEGKPHCFVNSLVSDHERILDLPVCIEDPQSKGHIFNPELLGILEKLVRYTHLRQRVKYVLVAFAQDEDIAMTVRDLLKVPYTMFSRVPKCGGVTTAEIMTFLDYFKINQSQDNKQ